MGGVVVLIGSASESSEQEGTARDAKLKVTRSIDRSSEIEFVLEE